MKQSELELVVGNRLYRAGISYEREHRFHPLHAWRADFLIRWPVEVDGSTGILLEAEGGLDRARSGHRSITGVLRDIRKSNWAAEAGYVCLRVTWHDLRGDNEWLEVLEILLEKNGERNGNHGEDAGDQGSDGVGARVP
jgi:hypothetical protein